MSEYQICKKIIDYESSIKLDLNEFDYVHHPDVYTSIINTVLKPKAITHYSNIYNENTFNLINKISDYNNIKSDNVLVAAGSDDGLEYIINRYINTDTNVIIFMPSYSYFEIIVKRKTNNIHYIPIDFNDNNKAYIDVCLEFYKDILDNSVVYIVNPNNPLGTIICKNSIENVINIYKKTIFIIDEAYIEFCKSETCVELIKKYDNIIITRTFSKAYGLAGIRLGYLIANEKTIRYVKQLYNEKNTTDMAKSAGLAIFNNIEYYKDIVNRCIDIRNDFKTFLDKLHIYNVKSYSNFISFYVGKNRQEFMDTLQSKNIYIRDRSTQIDMYGFVRITIGDKQHMRTIEKIINQNLHLFEINPLVRHYFPKSIIWKLKLLFKKLIDVISNTQLEFWLDGGTLLGFYRHNKGIIQWDNDIDLGIQDTQERILLNCKDELYNNGLRLKKNRTNCYYQIDFICDILDDNVTNDIHIDIFKYKEENNKLINTDPRFKINSSMKCNYIYNKEDLFPLKIDKFYKVLNINIPNNTESILNENILSDYKNIAKFERNNIEYEYKLHDSNKFHA